MHVLNMNGSAVADASEEAQELMLRFPYALIMCRAELNLLESIQNERLASEPLSGLKRIAHQLATSIGQLHTAGLVHGDVKPRNICRFGSRFRLIDFDKTFRMDAMDPNVGCSSTAYAAPELVQHMAARSAAEQPCTLIDPVQVDLWSFAVTLFEMCAGAPLFNNSYDLVTHSELQKMMQWNGLSKDDLTLIEGKHGAAESTALNDLLLWALDGEPTTRPKSMACMLEHAFFNPTNGTMREHFVVDEIKKRLEGTSSSASSSTTGGGADRIDCTVMVSYCWADTSFALNRLAMELASTISGMWLDRLGGDRGMGEFAKASMQRGVEGADVVIAVVSPAYIKSVNCGYEMELAQKLGKPIIPVVLGVPFSEWPPARIGQTAMVDQFATATGDMKIFVDMTKGTEFYQKYRKELLPRLIRGPDGYFGGSGGATAGAAADGSEPVARQSPGVTASMSAVVGSSKTTAHTADAAAAIQRITDLESEVERLQAVLKAFLR
jgi:hypothetical protein